MGPYGQDLVGIVSVSACIYMAEPHNENRKFKKVMSRTYLCLQCAYVRHRGRHGRCCGMEIYCRFGCEKAARSPQELLAQHAGHIKGDIHRCPGCDSRLEDINDLTAYVRTYAATERLA